MEAVLLAVVLSALSVSYADIQSISYPAKLEELYKAFGSSDAVERIGESIGSYSISTFAFKNHQKINPYVPTDAVRNYINKASQNNFRTRRKRASFLPQGQYRLRKEYRMMSNKERNTYHYCMNQLRFNTTVSGTSGYGALESLHKENINAHGGVSFLAWHRVYLWALENALRNLGGDCSQLTLPYWDCTAEFYANSIAVDSARHSAIFSEQFAGSGTGYVQDGPFKDWGLFRQVVEQGDLFSRARIEELKSDGTNYLIANPFSYYSLEMNHNGIHRFVGGGLLSITLAPRDPIFFLLHCYIDYVWEEIRQAMTDRGLDPSVYPWTWDDDHSSDKAMSGFPSWTNEEGYSNLWYERHVRYQPSFSCQDGTCSNTEGLECVNIVDEGQQCMAVPLQDTNNGITTTPPSNDITTSSPDNDVTTAPPDNDVTTAPPDNDVTTAPPDNDVTTSSPDNDVTTASPDNDVTTAPPDNGITTPPTNIDTSVPPTTTLPWWFWFGRRRKREATRQSRHDCTSKHIGRATQSKVHVCDSHTCPSAPTSMQNTYTINDVTDATQWVYIPIKVIYERPRGLKFHAFASYSRKTAPAINSTMDIFDPAFNSYLERHLYTGDGRPYESCRINDAGSAKVFIRADGINYSGTSMEYAIVDERFPLSSQKAFIPIKDPTANHTEVCLMAYDSCGRLCLPTCHLKGTQPSSYTPCTGCIRVTNTFPKMYGRSIADIVANQWTFNKAANTEFLDPVESDKDTFLKFVCDASSKFPWQRQKP
ncbi:uncharacterized protein LOC117340764 [Pecten maximus]|uniref:uncharacterized protein LOC117340764 n=1 Tax=Pecten maximus TaxID=6579 RepID=UPI0014585E4D|nr:uncharacterized protein LOC117340764 [Pecten maximus]